MSEISFPQDSLLQKILSMSQQVNIDNIERHIRQLEEAGGHYSRVNFTPGNDSGSAYIYSELKKNSGIEVVLDTFFIESAQPPFNTKSLVNIIATLKGKSENQRSFILGAHLDCSASRMGSNLWHDQWQSLKAPGADDNATGVAALLEIARIISQPSFQFIPEYSIKLIAFGAEESGPAYSGHHYGSLHYAESANARGEEIIGMCSIDMIGYNDFYDFNSIVANGSSQWLSQKYLEAKDLFDIDLMLDEHLDTGNYSDHTSFWNYGYPAILMIEYAWPWDDGEFYQGNPYYHTSNDSTETLNIQLVRKVTQLNLAAAASFAAGLFEPIDLSAPAAPQLRYVKKDSTSDFKIEWFKPADKDLKGYRLFSSRNGTEFRQNYDESVLTYEMTFRSYLFTGTAPLYIRLYAADSIGNRSDPSDTYGVRILDDEKKILIVDGFDRFGGSGSWDKPYHDFIIKYAKSFNFSFESCSNDEIINNNIDLRNYELVIWILGDESTADETFNSQERVRVAEFLENGGKLFVSGSEIAWDLEGASSATNSDIQFLRTYLKARYIADDTGVDQVYGIESTDFAALELGFGDITSGSPYEEDYPDAIGTIDGSIPILKYNQDYNAAIAYTGSFNNSAKTGQIIYLAFPFETIWDNNARTEVMNAAFKYFNMSIPDAVSEDEESKPLTFQLHQNYPNPFNPTTNIGYRISDFGFVSLKIYDVLGKEITTLVNEDKTPGKYEIIFDASGLAAGVYIYSISIQSSGNRILYRENKKMVYLK
jgi:hypothetical protein